MNPELLKAAKEQLAAGMTPDEIKAELVERGLKPSDIEVVMEILESTLKEQQAATPNISVELDSQGDPLPPDRFLHPEEVDDTGGGIPWKWVIASPFIAAALFAVGLLLYIVLPGRVKTFCYQASVPHTFKVENNGTVCQFSAVNNRLSRKKGSLVMVPVTTDFGSLDELREFVAAGLVGSNSQPKAVKVGGEPAYRIQSDSGIIYVIYTKKSYDIVGTPARGFVLISSSGIENGSNEPVDPKTIDSIAGSIKWR